MASTVVDFLPAVPPKPDIGCPENLLFGMAKRMATPSKPYCKYLRRRFRKFVCNWVRQNLEPLQSGHFSSLDNDDGGVEDCPHCHLDPSHRKSHPPSCNCILDVYARSGVDPELGLCLKCNGKAPPAKQRLDSWLAETNYPLWRKEQLRRAYHKVYLDTGQYKFDPKTDVHTYGKVKIFVKDEWYPTYKYPRGIWARQDEFKVLAGPIFKEIERVLFKLPYFIKKIPIHERPQYILDLLSDPDMIYQVTDYTSFEAHFNEEMQNDCEFELYRHMLQHNDTEMQMLYMIFRVLNEGNLVINKFMTAFVPAKRMSGEMNTSLGNGFSNLMFMLFGLHENKIQFKGLVVEGDDGLLSAARRIPEEYFTKMGLNVKLEVKDKLSEASFCGLVFDEEEKIIISDPMYYLCTVPWISPRYTFASRKTKLELLKSKVLSMLWQFPGCPILDAYAKRMMYLLEGIKERVDTSLSYYDRKRYFKLMSMLEKNGVPMKEPGLRTRALMEKLFNIPVESQLKIESDIAKMTLESFVSEAALEYCPRSWKTNFEKYCFKNYHVDYTSLEYPPLRFGRCDNILSTLPRLQNKSKLITLMNGRMTKKQFLATNKQNFDRQGLSASARLAKYQAYKQRRARMITLSGQNMPARQQPRAVNNPKSRSIPRQKILKTPSVLSKCLLDYAKASIDPFDQSIADPCIPDNLVLSSYKFSVRIQGQMVVGTQGVGLIGFNPWSAAAYDNGANATKTDYPIYASTATYSVDTLDFQVPYLTAGEAIGVNSNSTLGSQYLSAAPIRLVAAGCEIMYTGVLLNQAGAITTLQVRGCDPAAASNTIAQVRNDPRSRTCSVSKGARCYISYYPTSQDLLSYKNFSNYRPSENGPSNTQGVYAPLMIAVVGATPGTTFQFNAICFYEAQLPGASSTPSHSDPIGFPAFQSARSQLKATDNPSSDLKNVLVDTLKNVASSVSGILPMAGGALGAYFGNPTLGTAAGTAGQGLLNAILGGASEQF